MRNTRIFGPFIAVCFSILSTEINTILHASDVALILTGWCTWVALIDPLAGLTTTGTSGFGFIMFHAEPQLSLAARSHNDIVTTALLVSIGTMVSVITMYRVNQAVVRLNKLTTIDAMDDFLASATRDQPTVLFARRAFDAISAELAFIDVRLEKAMSVDIPTYDLAVWNRHKPGDHPRVVEISPQGIAIKFENPRIWYELVFTSRRGYGTLPVRRFLLQNVANRVEEFLTVRLHLDRKNNHR